MFDFSLKRLLAFCQAIVVNLNVGKEPKVCYVKQIFNFKRENHKQKKKIFQKGQICGYYILAN